MLRDLRFAFRTLLRNPGFGATVTFTLALGIGATTALFTVVNAVLLDPLPFPNSRQLVQVWRSELPALTYGAASYPRYLDWRLYFRELRDDQRAFTDLGAWAPRGMTVTGGAEPERVNGAVASASFFRVIGAPPVLGSWISDNDDSAAGQRVAVISHAYWHRRFQGATSALGETLVIDGQPFTIIGVAPAGYAEAWRPDVWVPLGLVGASTNRDSNFLLSFGRLRDGSTIDDARRSLAELAAKMQRDHAIDKYGFTARPIHEVITETASQGLWVLLGASGLLLLIACANVANLLLARSVARQHDLAIRASLGGTRGRLLGQVASESLALGVVASLLGAGLAWLIVRLFIAWAPASFPRLDAIAIDTRVLVFAGGVAIVTALVAGLAPAIHLMRSNLVEATRAGGGRGTTSASTRLASRALVIVEMSLAVALVAAAGLLAKSVLKLESQDLGFTREPVLTFGVGLPPLAAPDNAAVSRIHQEFLTRVRSLSGVTHASAINLLPIARTGSNGPVRRADDAPDSKGVPVTEFRAVMDGYFDTMDVPLIAGRAIDARDRDGTPAVAVVNDTLASRLFPGVAPAGIVGRQVRIGWLRGAPSEVVGVVSSVRSRRPDAPPDPEIYVPFAQVPQAAVTYVVRGAGDVSALTAPIRSTLAGIVPDVPLSAVRTLGDVVASSTQLSRLVSWLSVVFAILAATLAVLGVYSVLSYAVAQRMREFAIRAAVGAARAPRVSMVLREGVLLSGAGIICGTLLALQASGLLRRLLYGVSETDPIVFAVAAVGLAAVAAAGYLIPAARAARANPIHALRLE
jgi:putative ABC transport system permease protein